MKGIIYKITNLINKKVYIGQTIVSLSKRLSSHKNEKKTSLISIAIKKYGFHNFKSEIIDVARTQNSLNKKEKYWISFYDSTKKKNGYNIENGGREGFTYTEELKRRIGKSSSKRNKGKGNPMYGKKRTKEELDKMLQSKTKSGTVVPIYCYDLDGNFIKKFISKHEASRELKIDRKSLNCVLKGLHKKVGNYKFYYNESENNGCSKK